MRAYFSSFFQCNWEINEGVIRKTQSLFYGAKGQKLIHRFKKATDKNGINMKRTKYSVPDGNQIAHSIQIVPLTAAFFEKFGFGQLFFSAFSM